MPILNHNSPLKIQNWTTFKENFLPNIVVGVIVLNKVEDEMEHQLPADGLVAVHVCHVLHVRLPDHVLVRGGGDHHHPQLPTLKVRGNKSLELLQHFCKPT